MDARRTLMLLALFLGLALLAGCAPEGWPREAAAPTPVEPTAAPTGEAPPYPPPPTVTPAPTDPIRGYPVAPTPEGLPSRTPTPLPTPVVTPTEIPFPTLIPTPVVTPWPAGEPPFIPELTVRTPEPFTLVYRVGDTIRAVESDGTGERLLLDVAERHGLRLATRADGVFEWQQGGPSPDGRYLALVADYSIHLFDLETGEARLLVEGAVEPVWSPDGTRIAYRDWGTGALRMADTATGETRDLYAMDWPDSQRAYVTFMAWSPDGGRICFMDELQDRTYALVVVSVDEAQPPIVLVEPGVNAIGSPKWSPIGEHIAFVRTGQDASGHGDEPDLWLTDPDGTSLTRLTRYMRAGSPKWSPDGAWLAFAGYPAYEDENPDSDIWLLDPHTGNLTRVTQTPGLDEGPLAWTPDGVGLVMTRHEMPGGDGYSMLGLNLADGTEWMVWPDSLAASWLRVVHP